MEVLNKRKGKSEAERNSVNDLVALRSVDVYTL